MKEEGCYESSPVNSWFSYAFSISSYEKNYKY